MTFAIDMLKAMNLLFCQVKQYTLEKRNKQKITLFLGVSIASIIFFVLLLPDYPRPSSQEMKIAALTDTILTLPVEISNEKRDTVRWIDFGIKATNSPHQNNMALEAFNKKVKGKGKPKYFFDAKNLGLIEFTWNLYLADVLDFICDLRGTQLRCVSGSVWWGAKQPIMNHSFYDNGGNKIPGKNIIRTAKPGDLKFYIPSADEELYNVGRKFFVGADERQFYGWPPNFLVSEWHEVKNTGTDSIGTYVQLVNPIEKRWDVNYYDILNYETIGFHVGKPRVWFTDSYPEYAEFVGGEFLKNPSEGSGSFFFHAKKLITRNIILGPGVNGVASENQVAVYYNLTSKAGHEIDKSVGYVEYNGGASGWMQTAGAEKVVLKSHKLTYGTNLSADYVHIQNCELDMQKRYHPALYPHPEGKFTKEYIIKDLAIKNVSILDGQTNLCHRVDFTIDGKINQTNGSDIIFPSTNPREGLAKLIYPDCLLWAYSAEKNILKVARVSHIEAEGSKFIIKNTGAKWATGDKIFHSRVGYIKDLGGNTSDKWGSPFFGGTDLRWKGNTGTNVGRRTTTFAAKDFKWISNGAEKRMFFDGFIHSITINVLRSVPHGIIWYKNDYGDWNKTRIFQIDLRIPGKRVMTKDKATGFKPGEYFNTSNLKTFIQDIPYSLGAPEGTNLNGLFTITIDWTPYANS